MQKSTLYNGLIFQKAISNKAFWETLRGKTGHFPEATSGKMLAQARDINFPVSVLILIISPLLRYSGT